MWSLHPILGPLSNVKCNTEENKENLAAMEQLPIFLNKMSSRNSLAGKLERIAVVFVQHARSVIHPQGMYGSEQVRPCSIATDHHYHPGCHSGEEEPSSTLKGSLPDYWPSTANTLDWDSLFNHTITPHVLDQPQAEIYGLERNDLTAWTNEFFGNAFVDWVGWDSQVCNF